MIDQIQEKRRKYYKLRDVPVCFEKVKKVIIMLVLQQSQIYPEHSYDMFCLLFDSFNFYLTIYYLSGWWIYFDILLMLLVCKNI